MNRPKLALPPKQLLVCLRKARKGSRRGEANLQSRRRSRPGFAATEAVDGQAVVKVP